MSNPIATTSIDFPEKLQFLFQPARFKVMWGGRMALKSWSSARALLIHGLSGQERILCVRELQKSIDESVHKLLADQISLMGMNYLYEVQQAHILGRGSAQGTEFSFEGLRHNVSKVKSYEGITKCWGEEAAKLTKVSFNTLVPTIFRNAKSEIWLTFNPELDEDFIYQHFVVHEPPPGSIVVKTTYADNNWLAPEVLAEIEHMRQTDPDEYLHVYEGHTKVVLDGAIFADELREVALQDRIRHVPLDRSIPVSVVFDLGRSDHTSMWFFQKVGFEYHLVDFYQNRLKHIDHYLEVMQRRGYVYGLIFLPHDAKAKTLGTKMSIQEQVNAVYGWEHVRLVPKLGVADKINAARTVFPSCYFDKEKCAEGLHALRHYQYSVDPVTKKFSLNPDHNWASDAADAFQYFAISTGMRLKSVECKLERPKSLGLDKLMNVLTGKGLGASEGTTLRITGNSSGHGWLGR
jgi:phage terminase large subunit